MASLDQGLAMVYLLACSQPHPQPRPQPDREPSKYSDALPSPSLTSVDARESSSISEVRCCFKCLLNWAALQLDQSLGGGGKPYVRCSPPTKSPFITVLVSLTLAAAYNHYHPIAPYPAAIVLTALCACVCVCVSNTEQTLKVSPAY